MSKHQPFVIPAGVSLDLSDRGVSVSHVGDIILQSSLGDRMNAVVSTEGSVTLRGKFDLDRVEAPTGTVRLEGSLVKARSVKASVVEIVATKFEGVSVQGEKQVVLGTTTIRADVLAAPRIDIDAKASGRVPIIECRNEPGPNAIKGGFSAAEYDELIGNVEAYLSERGVEPLEPGDDDEDEQEDDEEPSDVVIEAHAADEAELEALDDEDDSVPSVPSEESDEDPDTYTEDAVQGVRVATAAATEEPIIVEDGHEPLEEPSEDLEEPSIPEVQPDALTPIETEDLQLPPGARGAAEEVEVEVELETTAAEQIAQVDETFQDIAPETDEAHSQLLEILAELRSCYDESEQPPVLTDLAELVDARQYDEIVASLPQIWNDLVKYHRERGLRIRRQVTTTFNNIMTIVKNAPSVTLGQQ